MSGRLYPGMAPFRLLVVCTGNICRSPIGSAWLEHWLNEESPGSFEVTSAGTAAVVGSEMERRAMGFLPPETDGTLFRSQQIDVEALEANDLILTADRGQRSYCASLHPELVHRMFTLREYGRMVQYLLTNESHMPRYEDAVSLSERWRIILDDAPSVRPQIMAGDPFDDDIVDPYGRSSMVYKRMMREMMPALEQLRDISRS